ncbi:TPA: hydrogenase iron-sulfur subunit [Candidatus Poribacteria bacterium]|nr:hydrogenase iron-sulfur subunit [Candidatus Poribacteria bacterium]
MKDFHPQITAFCCHNAIYSEEDLTERRRLQSPSNVKVIEMPCSGKTEVIYLLKALESGADGVYVVGCPEGECRFLEGNLRAKKRVKYTQQLLDEIGIEKDRIQMYNLSASMKEKFQKVATEMIEKIRNIGPSPVNKVKEQESET